MGCEYEMGILDQKGATTVVLLEYHLSGRSAIRAARRAADEKPFEVWLDDKRVYPAE